MNENLKNLYYKFKKIRNLGYIKSINKGSGSIGLTFEGLLNKEIENFELPDYHGIEIKVKRRYSKGYITLFSAAPDGEFLFETERLRKNFGYPDKELREYNIFYGTANAIKKNFIGATHKHQLEVDEENQLIRLNIYNKKDILIDNQTCWSFELLKEKLERKLQFLALIRADIKTIENQEYFRYYYITFYKLKNFETFINLIKTGKISITFQVGVIKKGARKGKPWDHGTSFSIHVRDLEHLYNETQFY